MGCLQFTFDFCNGAQLATECADGIILDVELENGASLDVTPENGASLCLVSENGAALDVECKNVKGQLTFGEVCSVEGGTVTVLCASDGELYFSNGDYFRLPDDDEDDNEE